MYRSVNFFSAVFISFLMFFCITTSVLADWKFQDSGVTENLNDVFFVDELNGWAVGDNSTIIATTDGGETWVRQDSPVDGLVLRKVQFANHDVGFACGQSTYGTLIHTIDGGKTWKIMDFGPDSRTVWGFYLVNSLTGWVTVEFVNGIAPGGDETHILFTSDGGLSWESQFVYGHQLRDMYFIDPNSGWAIGSTYMDTFDDTDVFRTTDGGVTWQHVSTLSGTRQKVFATDEVVWAIYGGILFSFDGGLSWDVSGYTDRIYDLAPLKEKEALIFGADPEILLTVDGGITRTSIGAVKPENVGVWSIYAINTNVFWLVGNDGNILKFIPESSTNVDTILEQLPLIQIIGNSPNPANLATTINYSITEPGNVKINIYSVSGQKVETLVDDYIPAGKHAVKFDGSSLASGVYFYMLESKGFSKSGKMLLVK